ncbi:hypothetical protein LXA43DRAFT_85218 [Ganoderma leucocontextum]|nr:hypothetical protein LXA43DRAFT_85218 [Ganoderma leucocontextum]
MMLALLLLLIAQCIANTVARWHHGTQVASGRRVLVEDCCAFFQSSAKHYWTSSSRTPRHLFGVHYLSTQLREARREGQCSQPRRSQLPPICRWYQMQR